MRDLEAHGMRNPQKAALEYGRRVWPNIMRCAPKSADEIRGIARGSGIPLETIVALNCYD